MTIIHQIRKEFDEPFRDVVAGFAKMGYSQTAAASACDVARSTFQYHVQRFGLCKLFNRSNYIPACKSHPRKGNEGKRKQVYSDETLLSILRKYSINIGRDYFNFLQVNPCASTYIKRFGSWKKAKILAHKECDRKDTICQQVTKK